MEQWNPRQKASPSPKEREVLDDDGEKPVRQKGGRNKRRKKSSFKIGNLLTWALVLLLAALVISLGYLQDESPPWDDDLKLPPSTDEAGDMSAPVRMKALLTSAALVDVDALPPQPPWQWSTPALSQVLEIHSAVLDNFRDLLEEQEEDWHTRSFLWKVEDTGEDRGWAAIMKIKQVEAAYLARRGHEQAAFLAAADMAVMAHLLERLHAWPSFMERALEFHQRSAESLAELLRTTRLTEAVLQEIQLKEYAPCAPSPAALQEAISGFYSFERKLLLGPEQGEPHLPPGYVPARPGWVFFKPNTTLHLLADSFRELKDIAGQRHFTTTNQITYRLQQRHARVPGLGHPNRDGEEYFASRIRLYARLPERQRLARARHSLVMALFAIRRMVAAESRIPQSLEELVPKYLSEVPTDPFKSEPLVYQSDRGWVHSVGTDLKDEGGKPTAIPMDDPTEPTVETGIGVARATPST